MEGMHEILAAGIRERDVLATVIQVEGSAYRGAGACMLFRKDGTRIGVLSAGCLEEDAAARVPHIIDSGEAEIVIFDMRAEDDLSWGQGAGCNGAVHVLLQPIDARLLQHLTCMQLYVNNGMEVTMLQKLNGSACEYLFMSDMHTFGEWCGNVPQQIQAFASEKRKSGTYHISELNTTVYTHTIRPKSRVIVFGAGDDARPLVRLAAQTGFSVTVVDWRPALCSRERFPYAERLLISSPTQALQKLGIQPNDFVLVMTHQFQRDQQIVELLLRHDIQYIGVLGSQERAKRLLDGNVPAVVKSPVGLSIGAEGPEEIAVSIVAELISMQRDRRNAGLERNNGNEVYLYEEGVSKYA